MKRLRLAFMGTPDFAVPSLRALIDAGHDVPCVYTQPPRPAGRGHRDTPSPVHAFAADRGIEVRHPASLKGAADQAAFAALAQIGSASCRERGCQYVSISVVAVPLK